MPDFLGGFGATGIAVLMEEGNKARFAQLQGLVGIGAVEEQGLNEVAFPEARGERLEVMLGMGSAGLGGIEEGAGPELVQPLGQAGTEAAMVLFQDAQAAHLLAELEVGAGRGCQRVAQAAGQQVPNGGQGHLVGTLQGEEALPPVAFHEGGVELAEADLEGLVGAQEGLEMLG